MNIIEIFEKFPTQEDCLSYLEYVRWNNTPKCPYCSSEKSTPLKSESRYHCNDCNTSYSVTVGTIFHRTRLPLQKWFLALTLILNAKKGLSARQISRDLKVNKDTAWRISMKIREAMTQHGQKELLQGVVEVDETYVGGKPRKSNSSSGGSNKRGRGTKKTPVVGMISRDGKVKAESFKHKRLTSKNLTALVRKNVDVSNTTLMTDQFKGYLGISRIMSHKVIDHSVWYVAGDTHTNNIESFWALLKRGIVGQYHKVSDRHLNKYIDEFCYRFNNRDHDDLFGMTIQKGVRC